MYNYKELAKAALNCSVLFILDGLKSEILFYVECCRVSEESIKNHNIFFRSKYVGHLDFRAATIFNYSFVPLTHSTGCGNRFCQCRFLVINALSSTFHLGFGLWGLVV